MTPLSPTGPYQAGEILAERYEVRDQMGAGPLSWLYQAFDQQEAQLVALRVVKPSLLPRDRDHEVFRDQLQGRFPPAVNGLGRPPRTERLEAHTLVITDLVDGLPLRTFMDLRKQQGRAFSALETLAVLQEAANILSEALSHGGHGDLRPCQVLVLEQRLVLEGFGLAPSLPAEETVRALRQWPVASGYLAPEVVEGRLGDPRSDVYALAMMAGELLSGRAPPGEGLGKHEFLSQLPPMVVEAVRSGLDPHLDQRESSPLEFVRGLRFALGLQNSTTPSGETNRTSGSSWSSVPAVAAEEDDEEEPTTQRSLKTSNLNALSEALGQFASSPPGTKAPASDESEPTRPAISASRTLDSLRRPPPEDTQKNAAPAIFAAAAALEQVEAFVALDEETSTEMITLAAADFPTDGDAQGDEELTLEHDSALAELASANGSPSRHDRVTPVLTSSSTPSLGLPEERERPSPPAVPGAVPKAALGLDPRLVRAARKLDQQRHVGDQPEPPDSGAPEQGENGRPPAEEHAGAFEHLRPEITRESSLGSPDTEEELLSAPQPGNASERHRSEEGDEESTEKVEKVPSSLVGNILGPIHERLSGGSRAVLRSSPSPAAVDEPSPLPAVLVDATLSELEPAPTNEEPTFVVSRAPSPGTQAATLWRRPGPQGPSPNWWQWTLVMLLVSGGVLLFGLMGLWLSRCR